jgi:hypothetical protein
VCDSDAIMGAAQAVCRGLRVVVDKRGAASCLQEISMWQYVGWALEKLLLPCVGGCAIAGGPACVLSWDSAPDMLLVEFEWTKDACYTWPEYYRVLRCCCTA